MKQLNKSITDKTALYYLGKFNNEATVRDLVNKFDIPSNVNLSGSLSALPKNMLATAKKNAEGKKVYKITKKGLKKLSEESFLAKIQSPEDLKQISLNVIEENKSKKVSGQGTVISKTITPTANLAINGITDLIQENQKLDALLKGIYLQLHARYGMNDEPNQG